MFERVRRDCDAPVGRQRLLQRLQDHQGLLRAQRLDPQGLEAALEGPVLLDDLPVLVIGGRADAGDLAARQRGLEVVGEGDEGVQLVQEEQDAVLGGFFQERLKASGDVAAVPAREEGGALEADDARAAQRLGHASVHDPLGQAFDDGGLADAGGADQDGVALGAPAERLDHQLKLVFASDERPDLALLGGARHVHAQAVERGGRALGAGRPGFFTGNGLGVRRRRGRRAETGAPDASGATS